MTGLPCHLFFGGKMRTITEVQIINAVKEALIEANTSIPSDITKCLCREKALQKNELAEGVIDVILKNNAIASESHMPICQDTGIFFVKVGNRANIDTSRTLQDILDDGVRLAYKEGSMRMSVVRDPLNRKNTCDNTPSVVYTEIVNGDNIEITVIPKGFGSENMSQIKMFNPTATKDEIIDFVVEVVKSSGSNPCPPIIVGIGIGGTFEYSAVLSKKALLKSIEIENTNPFYAEMEKEILNKINALNIGVQGLGGPTTALGVNIEHYPTHIAGLPVAVNICCHVCRHVTKII